MEDHPQLLQWPHNPFLSSTKVKNKIKILTNVINTHTHQTQESQ